MTTATGAVLLLAGCGGGTDPSALPPGSASAATTPAATAAAPTGDPVTSAYLRYWDAVLAAHRASDPGSVGLAAVAAGPELKRVRDTIERNRIQQVSVRGEVTHDPAEPAVSGGTATVEDCYDVTGWNPVDVKTGERIDAVEAGGTGRYRARWTLRGAGAAWKVVDQKALGGC